MSAIAYLVLAPGYAPSLAMVGAGYLYKLKWLEVNPVTLYLPNLRVACA